MGVLANSILRNLALSSHSYPVFTLRSESGRRYVPPYNLAVVHQGLGEREEALAWLEKAFEGRDVLLTFAAVDRTWDTLRSDQRFVSLLERMKLRK